MSIRDAVPFSFTQHLEPFGVCPTVSELELACSADHRNKKNFFDRLLPEHVQKLIAEIQSIALPLRVKLEKALQGPIKRIETDHQMRNGIAS